MAGHRRAGGGGGGHDIGAVSVDAAHLAGLDVGYPAGGRNRDNILSHALFHPLKSGGCATQRQSALGSGGLRYADARYRARISAMRTRKLLAATCAFTCALAITAWAGGAGFGDDDDNSEEEGPSYFGFV